MSTHDLIDDTYLQLINNCSEFSLSLKDMIDARMSTHGDKAEKWNLSSGSFQIRVLRLVHKHKVQLRLDKEKLVASVIYPAIKAVTQYYCQELCCECGYDWVTARNTAWPEDKPKSKTINASSNESPKPTHTMEKYTNKQIATPTLIRGKDISEMTENEVFGEIEGMKNRIERNKKLGVESKRLAADNEKCEEAIKALVERLDSFDD